MIFTLISFDHKHPKRMARLVVLGMSTALTLLFGLYLYKVYYLDEGLVSAALNGDAAQVNDLLSHGADPNAEWEDGTTAIQEAQSGGHKEIVKMLRKAGAAER